MAIAIFAVLSVITINLMNGGINTAQRTLEYTMARNEIDSQAEALRYIHQSYIAERQLDEDASKFNKLWVALSNIAMPPVNLEDNSATDPAVFDVNQLSSCGDAYTNNGMVKKYNAFVLNTRLVMPKPEKKDVTYGNISYDDLINYIIVGVNVNNGGAETDTRLKDAPVYPRIVYRESNIEGLYRDSWGGTLGGSNNNADDSLAEKKIYNLVNSAEGIFVIAVGDNSKKPSRSNYFDFYIRTCWHSVGASAPSTVTTIVRLYNPEVIE